VKQQRNNQCSCGSGIKYKRCCMPIRMQAKEAIHYKYLMHENGILREVIIEADKRLKEAGLSTMEEWIDERIKETNKEEK